MASKIPYTDPFLHRNHENKINNKSAGFTNKLFANFRPNRMKHAVNTRLRWSFGRWVRWR